MLPEDDRWSETRSQLLAQMDVSMGGRVAEEMIFGPEYITTGEERGPCGTVMYWTPRLPQSLQNLFLGTHLLKNTNHRDPIHIY